MRFVCMTFWLTAVVVSASAGSARGALANLVGHWGFDETSGATAATSVNSPTIDGTLYTNGGSPAFSFDTGSVAGVIGNALDFTAANGDGMNASNNALLAITGNMTFQFWVNFDSIQSSGHTFFVDKHSGGSSGYFGRFTEGSGATDGQLTARFRFGSAEIQSTYDVYQTGQWYHVAFTGNDGTDTFNVYIDGILNNSVTSTAAWNSVADPFLFGRTGGATGSEPGVDGKFDDVGVFDRDLSAKEIAAVHGLGYLSRVALDSDAITDVLDVFDAQTGVALAGTDQWHYVTGLTGGLGASGVAANGAKFIVLDTSGNGVATVLPEPTALLLGVVGLLCLVLHLPRSRRRKAVA